MQHNHNSIRNTHRSTNRRTRKALSKTNQRQTLARQGVNAEIDVINFPKSDIRVEEIKGDQRLIPLIQPSTYYPLFTTSQIGPYISTQSESPWCQNEILFLIVNFYKTNADLNTVTKLFPGRDVAISIVHWLMNVSQLAKDNIPSAFSLNYFQLLETSIFIGLLLKSIHKDIESKEAEYVIERTMLKEENCLALANRLHPKMAFKYTTFLKFLDEAIENFENQILEESYGNEINNIGIPRLMQDNGRIQYFPIPVIYPTYYLVQIPSYYPSIPIPIQ